MFTCLDVAVAVAAMTSSTPPHPSVLAYIMKHDAHLHSRLITYSEVAFAAWLEQSQGDPQRTEECVINR